MIKITAGIAAALVATTFAITAPAIAAATTDIGSATSVSPPAAKGPNAVRGGAGSPAPTPRAAGVTSKIGSLNSRLAGLGITLP